MKAFYAMALGALLALLSCASRETVSPEFSVEYNAQATQLSPDGGMLPPIKVHWKACQIKVSSAASFLSPSVVNIGSKTGEGTVELHFTLAANDAYAARKAQLLFESAQLPTKEILFTQEGLGEEAAQVSVDPSQAFQSWDGFGAMNLGNNWNLNLDWTEADASALLGDMGLSIMRIRIPYDESRWEALAAGCKTLYDQYGVKILATPWSMPAKMKTPEQTQAKKDGLTSSLKAECYEEYARYLERFAAFMKGHGAPLAAISVQNEPDYAPEYDGCVWSAAQHLSFVRDYGHLIQSAPLVTAESFSARQDFYRPVLEDDTACANLAIVGGHLYGTQPQPFPLAAEKGKRLWMTEHLLNESWTQGTDHWRETLTMLKEIHDCLECGWNAYIWWYGCRYYSLVGDGDEDTRRGQILPRGYAYAQFSAYIRPGDVRVSSAVEGPEDLLCTAFKGADGGLRIVLVNLGRTRKHITLNTSGIASATYTSRNANVAHLEVAEDAGKIKLALPGESIGTVLIQ